MKQGESRIRAYRRHLARLKELSSINSGHNPTASVIGGRLSKSDCGAPLPSADVIKPHHPRKRNPGIDMVSLIAGIFLFVAALAVLVMPFFTDATSSTAIYVVYGILVVLSAASAFFFGVRSIKKRSYPNITGIIGLILCLIVLYNVLSVILVYAWAGSS